MLFLASYFRSFWARRTGKRLGIAAFVEEARLAEASRRLAGKRVNVEAVGDASEDVFRRAFERRFGVTPKQYRGASVSSRSRLAKVTP